MSGPHTGDMGTAKNTAETGDVVGVEAVSHAWETALANQDRESVTATTNRDRSSPRSLPAHPTSGTTTAPDSSPTDDGRHGNTPRVTPDGQQMDFVEVMEIEDGLIRAHRVGVARSGDPLPRPVPPIAENRVRPRKPLQRRNGAACPTIDPASNRHPPPPMDTAARVGCVAAQRFRVDTQVADPGRPPPARWRPGRHAARGCRPIRWRVRRCRRCGDHEGTPMRNTRSEGVRKS